MAIPSITSLFDRHLVGLDIGVSSIKAVELQQGRATRLASYARVPLPANTISPDGEIRERAVLVDAIGKAVQIGKFSTKKVAVGAFGNSIIVKKITVPPMGQKELQEQLYWEAEQYIPFDINEVNLDFAVVNSTAGIETTNPTMEVLLVAAKKDYVKTLTAVVAEAGLIAEVVDIQSFALGNSFEFNYGHLLKGENDGSANIILDFGAGSTKVSLVEGDKTTFSRELRQCGMSCTLLLSERLEISFEEAEEAKINATSGSKEYDVIAEFNSLLVDEVSRTIDFFLSQSVDRSLAGIYVCGGGCKTPGLALELESRLPTQIQLLNPVQNIAGTGRKMGAETIRELAFLGAVAVGLALRKRGDVR